MSTVVWRYVLPVVGSTTSSFTCCVGLIHSEPHFTLIWIAGEARQRSVAGRPFATKYSGSGSTSKTGASGCAADCADTNVITHISTPTYDTEKRQKCLCVNTVYFLLQVFIFYSISVLLVFYSFSFMDILSEINVCMYIAYNSGYWGLRVP